MSVKIELNRSGVSALLNSKGAEKACAALASQLASSCGPEYAAAAPHRTGQRTAVNVYPASADAAWENIRNDTLRRSVQSMEIVI